MSDSQADARAVVIDDEPLTVADVVAVARGARVELGPIARTRIAASRAVVDGLVHGESLVYGLNTGLGHMRDSRLPVDELAAMQAVTIRIHAGGIGPALPSEVVRAAMLARLAGIVRGGSGASPVIAETLAAMLDAGVTPVVPAVGSVGAGDLMHMAAIALVAMGEGEADLGGERLAGGEALARAGITPIRPGPKDGLTLVAANGVTIGHGALVIERATRLADLADDVLAVSLEAAGGNLSIVDEEVAAAKPVPGQAISAARIRARLAGSRLCGPDAETSVQDPLAFRVGPQVHGAYREVVRFATEAVESELAARDDNPLVSLARGTMISNGNFHPMLLALAVDAIRPALAHVGQISDRRAGYLWDRLIADPSSFTEANVARVSAFGSPLVRYSGAARAAELESSAAPATLGIGALDLGQEDHATNAPLAVSRTAAALDLALDVLVVELLTATASIGAREEARGAMAPGTVVLLGLVADAIGELGTGASAAAIHAAVRARLDDSATSATIALP